MDMQQLEKNFRKAVRAQISATIDSQSAADKEEYQSALNRSKKAAKTMNALAPLLSQEFVAEQSEIIERSI